MQDCSQSVMDSSARHDGLAHILNIPNELLDQIFQHLDNIPHSQSNFNSLPTKTWTSSAEQPLKSISTISRRFRSLVLPRLFKYTRLDPVYLTPFLEFVSLHNLTPKIETITAHLSGPYSHIHPAWFLRLLNHIPAARLSVGCEPHVFSHIAHLPLNLNDSWAFDVPYQLVSLTQSAASAAEPVSYDITPSLFCTKPWHALCVNEGSSLAAYATYEYYLKRPPSLLSNFSTYLSLMPAGMASELAIDPLTIERKFGTSAVSVQAIQTMLEGLLEFSYVAVFPFYNHVDDVLKCVRRMTHLQKFSVQLCPEQGSTVLEDEVKVLKGHIDMNDPWSEVRTGYNLVAHTVRHMCIDRGLNEFITHDIHVEDIRETITGHFEHALPQDWMHDGTGRWKKQPQLEETLADVLPTT